VLVLLEMIDQFLRHRSGKRAIGHMGAIARVSKDTDLVFHLHHYDRMLAAIHLANVVHQRGECPGVSLLLLSCVGSVIFRQLQLFNELFVSTAFVCAISL
jgi:hypothetical protein